MKTLLTDVRLSFPVLFEPKPFSAGDAPRYSAHGLIRIDEQGELLAKVKVDMASAATAKWGEKWNNQSFRKSVRLCLFSGAEKDQYAGYDESVMVVSANANPEAGNPRPTIVDRDRSPLTAGDGKPYAGCYVNMLVSFWAQDNQYGKRINAQLLGVQFLRDGDAFGGGERGSSDDFPELEPATETAESAADAAPWDDADPLG